MTKIFDPSANSFFDVDGKTCRLWALIDENRKLTTDFDAAHFVMYQPLDEVMPAGIKQKFRFIRIEPGSISKLIAN